MTSEGGGVEVGLADLAKVGGEGRDADLLRRGALAVW